MNDPTENLVSRVFRTLPIGAQTVKTAGWPLLLNTHMWNADDVADVPAGYAYFSLCRMLRVRRRSVSYSQIHPTPIQTCLTS